MKWSDKYETLVLIATLIITGLVTLLDFTGFLDEVPILAERVPTMTLLSLGLVASYLLLERRGSLANIQTFSETGFNNLETQLENAVHTVIDSVGGVEFRSFDTGNELLTYINKRMSEAESSIDDLSWSSAINLKNDLDTTRKLNEEYVEQVTKASKKLQYREVFIFNRVGRIKKLRQRLAENAPGYSCAYYEAADTPLLQFMIIDNEERVQSNSVS